MNALRTEELYAEALGRQVRLTQSFFEASAQELDEQARRRQPAGRNFAPEGLEKPYEEFLECLLFYYRVVTIISMLSFTGLQQTPQAAGRNE